MSNFIYDRYFDYKIFEFFRDKVFPTVNKYRKDEKEEDIYKHIFIAPEAISRKRAFQIQGVIYPYISLWASSQFEWTDKMYSRSVLRRDFSYIDPETKEVKYCNGFLYDQHKTYVVHAASYFQSFIQSLAMDMTDLDRLRYFTIDCSELLPGCKTRIELLPNRRGFNSADDESKSERNFNATFEYDMKVTYPVINKDSFLDKINIYLNESKIYESGVTII